MTDSPRSYRLPDPPITDSLTRQTFESYQRSLAMIASQPGGTERLFGLLTEVSARLEAQTRSAISQTLSEYASSRDTLVPRSTPKDVRSRPSDRSASIPSPQPSAIDLLSTSSRLGPRLATKLILSAARKGT